MTCTLILDEDMEILTPHYDQYILKLVISTWSPKIPKLTSYSCTDILRQSLTCYADLSPMQWHWSHRKQCYEPDWDVPRQCCDWNTVQEGAGARNTTGMVPIYRPNKTEVEQRLMQLESEGLPFP